MRINWNFQIVGDKTVLVPYQRYHVDKYHKWMKSAELQELTGSEPLTLDEEYDMQRAWREDADKCTFIVLDKTSLSKVVEPSGDDEAKQAAEVEAMVGDTNLFFNDDDDRHVAEIEVMIAETCARGKGIGKESLTNMIRYGIDELKVEEFVAKIKYGNLPSIKLFQKMGFKEVSKSDVFEETTYQLKVDPGTKSSLISICSYQVGPYQNSED